MTNVIYVLQLHVILLIPVLIGLYGTSVDGLMCYTCQSESINSSCYHNPVDVHWDTCDGECQVWTLFSEVDERVYMFERSCSTLCRDGCTRLADMEHRFVGCSTCCKDDFCNTGRGSSSCFIHFLSGFLLMCLLIIS